MPEKNHKWKGQGLPVVENQVPLSQLRTANENTFTHEARPTNQPTSQPTQDGGISSKKQKIESERARRGGDGTPADRWRLPAHQFSQQNKLHSALTFTAMPKIWNTSQFFQQQLYNLATITPQIVWPHKSHSLSKGFPWKREMTLSQALFCSIL